MSLDRLIELREKIGDEPIIPNAEDKREAMEMLRTPEKDMELDRAIDPKYSNKFASATPSYLYKGGQPDLEEQAENVRQAGRYGDTELMLEGLRDYIYNIEGQSDISNLVREYFTFVVAIQS